MHAEKNLDFSRIAQDLQIRKVQVENVVQLLDEGNTIPFITRYRKERTGGLNEDALRQIETRIRLQRQLADRKKTILKSIKNQGKLTDALKQAITEADSARRLEDLYLPFKPKKRSLATVARERGLEPLAVAIWNRDPAVSNLAEILPTMVDPDKDLKTVEDVVTGVNNILAEMVSEAANVRAAVRFTMWESGNVNSHKNEKLGPEHGKIYRDYFKFSEAARRIPPHRILALNRGEREGMLRVKLEWDAERARERALEALANYCQHQFETGAMPAPATTAPPTISAANPPAANAPSEPAPPTPETTAPENPETPAPSADISAAPENPEASAPSADNSAAPENPEASAPSADIKAESAESAPSESAPATSDSTNANAIAEQSDSASTATEPQTKDPESTSSPATEVSEASSAPSTEVSQATAQNAENPANPIPADQSGEKLSAQAEFQTPHKEILAKALDDALQRLVYPSLEKEIRRELREEAEAHAVHVFACNLRSLLLQRPLRQRRVLAIDPGFRTGCKIAALDEYGNLLDQAVIYPHPTKLRKKKDKGKKDKKPAQKSPADKKKDAAPAADLLSAEGQTTGNATPPEIPANGEGKSAEATANSPPLEAQPTSQAPAPETPADGEIKSTASAANENANGAPSAEQTPPVEEPKTDTPENAKAESESPASVSDEAAETAAPAPASEPDASATPEAVPTDPLIAAASDPSNQTDAAAPEKATADESAATPEKTTADDAAANIDIDTAAAEAEEARKHEEANEKRRQEAKAILEKIVTKHNLTVAALGNGTACRETEGFLTELINENLKELEYVIVNEAGASVYSVSAIGKEEFPDADATLRGTISIGRRLQDPLAELVKVDPPHIGIGLYQHDVDAKQLRESLEEVVATCVNQIGVDLNTASVPLLRYVAGLNQLSARAIVEHRKDKGPFKNRETIKEVPSIGEARFVQAAGFLKIHDGDNPLDMTWIHPESYGTAQRLLEQVELSVDAIKDASQRAELQSKFRALSPVELSKQLDAGEPTIQDIIDSLQRPGRDPREDLPLPVFRKGILQLEDLQPDMELKGSVLNVVDFGAFVDVGLKDSGLVHISQLANRFVKNPHEVIAVGDVVKVWVMKVDLEQRHVSLTMIPPGTPKQTRERRRPDSRPRQEGQPPRDAQHGKPPRQGGFKEGGPRRSGPHQKPREGAPAGSGPRHQRSRSGQQQQQYQSPQPPRKPKRQPPKPKLSTDALAGREDLRSFGELSAFFAAKTTRDEPKGPRKQEKQKAATPPKEEKPTESIQEQPQPIVADADSAESAKSESQSPPAAPVALDAPEAGPDTQTNAPVESSDPNEAADSEQGKTDHSANASPAHVENSDAGAEISDTPVNKDDAPATEEKNDVPASST